MLKNLRDSFPNTNFIQLKDISEFLDVKKSSNNVAELTAIKKTLEIIKENKVIINNKGGTGIIVAFNKLDRKKGNLNIYHDYISKFINITDDCTFGRRNAITDKFASIYSINI